MLSISPVLIFLRGEELISYASYYILDRSRPRQVRKNTLKDSKDLNDVKSQSKTADLLKSPKTDGSKKPDLRARYWKFLFDNLQRAVDAIYETCEQDESALECRVRRNTIGLYSPTILLNLRSLIQ